MKQKQQSGDNSTNLQAGHDINFTLNAGTYKRDFGIIDEIFKSVIKDLQISAVGTNNQHINLDKKIKLNFPSKEDRERIQQYFKYAYTKISLIEKRVQEEDTEVQSDLQGRVFNQYNLLKDNNLKNIEILEELFRQFIIPEKRDNPEYSNLTRAFILFFFDDCTIFEKTEAKK